MHSRSPIPDSISRLALYQGGVLTREQILGLGLSRHVLARLVREGIWSPICRGVVATAGVDWSASAWAAVLVAGDGARLGGAAAGFASGLLDRSPDAIDVWLPLAAVVPNRQPGARRWRFRRESPGVRASGVGSPPRTAIEDTVLDLAAEGSSGETIGWVTASVQKRLTTPRRLRAALDARQWCRHRRLIGSVLADVAQGVESPLELDYLRRVERAHGLPTAHRQARGRGTLVDALYEEWGLIVELDGHLGHGGEGRFRDMTRDNRSTGAGLATLRYGWVDVSGRPCAVAAQVGEVLSLRGWRGPWQPCKLCLPQRLRDSAA